METDGRDKLTRVTSRKESPYQVELKLFRLPEGSRDMNYMTYGLNMGKDGFLYFGVGDNDQNAHLFRLDPEKEAITDLGSFKDALPEDVFSRGNYGKFHVGPYQDIDGAIYFGSYFREGWDGEPSGRLFQYTEEKGVVDLGPTPNNQGTYFMHGDDKHGKLYLATVDSHFSIYDLKTGGWEDKGRFTSKAPFIGLTDRTGRLYMYGYDGKGDWTPGPATISRYDPTSNTLSTSKNAPPTLWVGAVNPGDDNVYTTNYLEARLFKWRLSDWPDYQYEELGRMDPQGRDVYSNDLSLTPDGKLLVLAGTIVGDEGFWGKTNLHGVWVYEIESGKKYLAADIGEVLSESFGRNMKSRKIYWTNANTVDEKGWIYIGIHDSYNLSSDQKPKARLLALRIQQK
jgi:hypothetical protein